MRLLKKTSTDAGCMKKKKRERDLGRVNRIGTELKDILIPDGIVQGCRRIAQYEDDNLT